MELVRLIRSRLERPTSVDPKRLSAMRPVKNTFVDSEPGTDGGLVLTAPLATQVRGTTAALAKWFKAPDKKSFELDPVGAFVWDMCDGKSNFEAISRRLRERYKMNRLEADTALAAYLQTLDRRKLISFVSSKKA